MEMEEPSQMESYRLENASYKYNQPKADQVISPAQKGPEMFSDHAKVALAVETDHDFYQRKLFESKFLKKWNFENDKVIEVDEETSFMP